MFREHFYKIETRFYRPFMGSVAGSIHNYFNRVCPGVSTGLLGVMKVFFLIYTALSETEGF